MKKIFFFAIFLLSGMAIYGNNLDTIKKYILVDSSMVGMNMYEFVCSAEPESEGCVEISVPEEINSMLDNYIETNRNRKLSGYRVRLYFDNKQDSRARSENIVARFNEDYPEIKAYRSYESPFFKVTAGNFRTRSEAFYFLEKIKNDYPSSFVLKDDIDYPVLSLHYYEVPDDVGEESDNLTSE